MSENNLQELFPSSKHYAIGGSDPRGPTQYQNTLIRDLPGSLQGLGNFIRFISHHCSLHNIIIEVAISSIKKNRVY